MPWPGDETLGPGRLLFARSDACFTRARRGQEQAALSLANLYQVLYLGRQAVAGRQFWRSRPERNEPTTPPENRCSSCCRGCGCGTPHARSRPSLPPVFTSSAVIIPHRTSSWRIVRRINARRTRPESKRSEYQRPEGSEARGKRERSQPPHPKTEVPVAVVVGGAARRTRGLGV